MAFEQQTKNDKFQTTETTTEQQRESMQNLSAELMSKSNFTKNNNSANDASANSSLPKVSIESGSLNFQKCSDGDNYEPIKLSDVLTPFPPKKEIVWDDGQDWGMGPKLSFGQ